MVASCTPSTTLHACSLFQWWVKHRSACNSVEEEGTPRRQCVIAFMELLMVLD